MPEESLTSRLVRAEIVGARRIVVKVGSSSLTANGGALDGARLTALADALAAARKDGREVVLVTSGAVAAGLPPLGLQTRPQDLASQQAAASVGQGLLMRRYGDAFAAHGITVGQVLLTVDDVTRQASYRNAVRTLSRLLEIGVLPIVNENDTVATHEIRFGDNDRLAALVAHLVTADALFLLSDVDALYTTAPSRPGAERIAEVESVDDLDVDTTRRGAAVGTGGMTTKLEAARIATAAGIPVVLGCAEEAAAVIQGGHVGTLFHPTGKRRPKRLLWLAFASQSRGTVVLDDGAVKALTERHASLLPAGIVEVAGEFTAGDPIKLVALDGRLVGRGIVNYDAAELHSMIGFSTRELVATRGPAYEREVVHRDFLMTRKLRKRPAKKPSAGRSRLDSGA
ncbi:glutamate 5-kinase [Propionicicella superfundia]|uniref:glutamate 5-kinase n=1 Tax=Propionicicella superfundia TaxID=348582 RepID=UPI000405D404|nr:glutamate 5-kinase [Propionicicella superfundia]